MWHLFFLKSYWKKHKRSLAALLLPGVLLCAVVVFYFLRVRGIFNTYINNAYDNVVGAAEVCICNEAYPESTIKELTEGKDCTYGYAYVTGKTGNSLGEFTCGYLDDPEGLAHVTFEEGRLPEKDNEVAMGRTILNRLGIVSNVGEKVVLDENEYTLCGIIIEGDPKFNKREQDPVDELYKQYADELPADTLVAEFPKIIFCRNDSEIKYSFTFIDGIFYDGKGKPKVNARLNEEINTKCASECYTDSASPAFNINRFKIYDKAVYSEAKTDDRILTGDNRWFLFLSIIAAVVAALSVLTVLHIILSDRKSDFESWAESMTYEEEKEIKRQEKLQLKQKKKAEKRRRMI